MRFSVAIPEITLEHLSVTAEVEANLYRAAVRVLCDTSRCAALLERHALFAHAYGVQLHV